jgi:hypothetical protein
VLMWQWYLMYHAPCLHDDPCVYLITYLVASSIYISGQWTTPASRAIEIKDGLPHLFQKPAKAPFIDRTQQPSRPILCLFRAAAAALPRNCSKPSLPWTILAAPLPPNAARS